ncbi:MAG: hypothetical protein R2854_06325 [Caldilineaceae bacterium]
MFFDLLAVRLNGPSGRQKDRHEHLLHGCHGTISLGRRKWSSELCQGQAADDADVTLTISRTVLNEILLGQATPADNRQQVKR